MAGWAGGKEGGEGDGGFSGDGGSKGGGEGLAGGHRGDAANGQEVSCSVHALTSMVTVFMVFLKGLQGDESDLACIVEELFVSKHPAHAGEDSPNREYLPP
mmetsp:Transcript_48094/g.79673  ORF Transcript_48094/g.79673 Transcript_48094/m.79673 type:complete len:101 (+) Transcript_48094:1855-2157(+)